MDTVNGLSLDQVKELLEPLEDGPHIEEKDGQKRLRPEYIRAKLSRIFGFNGWGEQDLELTHITTIEDPNPKSPSTTVVYRARQRLIIRDHDGSVRTFYDGAGAWASTWFHSTKSTIWATHSDAMNGARSVALCRAASSLGEQFGLSLYADGLGTATVGYSLPHQPLQHIYAAGDTEGEPDQGGPDPQYTQDPDEVPA